MIPNPFLIPQEMEILLRWRKRVVVQWVGVMLTALGVWAIAGTHALAVAFEFAAALLLAFITLLAVRTMRRGACPRCGGRIRFEPRIELPPACSHCQVAFRLDPRLDAEGP
jgi:hypothetical protein